MQRKVKTKQEHEALDGALRDPAPLEVLPLIFVVVPKEKMCLRGTCEENEQAQPTLMRF
jgi:hypothetical protein